MVTALAVINELRFAPGAVRALNSACRVLETPTQPFCTCSEGSASTGSSSGAAAPRPGAHDAPTHLAVAHWTGPYLLQRLTACGGAPPSHAAAAAQGAGGWACAMAWPGRGAVGGARAYSTA
jgi:hypothetical protein